MKIEVEDDPKIILNKLFQLNIEQLQEEINFANSISDKLAERLNKPHNREAYYFKWLYEYALSINPNYTKTKVRNIVKRVLAYYKEQNEAWQRDHSIKGKRLVYVMPKWDNLYKQYLDVKELFE